MGPAGAIPLTPAEGLVILWFGVSALVHFVWTIAFHIWLVRRKVAVDFTMTRRVALTRGVQGRHARAVDGMPVIRPTLGVTVLPTHVRECTSSYLRPGVESEAATPAEEQDALRAELAQLVKDAPPERLAEMLAAWRKR